MGLRSLVIKLLQKSDSSSRDAKNRSETTPVKEIKPFTAGTMRRSFSATVADELTLDKGSKLKAVYREDDWLYVHASDGQHGFVPETYCTLTVDRKPSTFRVAS
ncbi:SH3 domain protein [Cooperia oncophora]